MLLINYLGNFELFNEFCNTLKNFSLKTFIEKNTMEYNPKVIKYHTKNKENMTDEFLDGENLLYRNLESIKEICGIIENIFGKEGLSNYAEFLSIIENFKNDLNMNYINSNMNFKLDSSYDSDKTLINTQIYISEILLTIKLICINIENFYNNWGRGEDMLSNYTDYEKIYIYNYDNYDTHILCSNGLLNTNAIVAEVRNKILILRYLQLPLLSSKYISCKVYETNELTLNKDIQKIQYKLLHILIKKSLLYEYFIQDMIRFVNIFFPKYTVISYRDFLEYYLKNISLFIKITNIVLFGEIIKFESLVEYYNILTQNINCDILKYKEFIKFYNSITTFTDDNEKVFVKIFTTIIENYEISFNDIKD